jgi:hypothetical protein
MNSNRLLYLPLLIFLKTISDTSSSFVVFIVFVAVYFLELQKAILHFESFLIEFYLLSVHPSLFLLNLIVLLVEFVKLINIPA